MPAARPRVSHPASGAMRLIRASALTGLVLALSSTGHLLGGGAAPAAALVLVAGLPVFGVSLAVTGRPVGRAAAAVLLTVAQLALHHVFTLGAATTVDAAAGGHPHGACAGGVVSGPVASGAAPPGHGLDLRMVLGHAAAAAVVGAVLASLDRVLFLLADLLGRALRILVGALRPWPLRPAVPAVPALPRGVDRAVVPCRGPPSARTAAITFRPVAG